MYQCKQQLRAVIIGSPAKSIVALSVAAPPTLHTKQPHPLLKMKDTLQILRQQNMLHDDCINLPPHQALFVFVWGKPPMQPCMRCSPEVDDNASYSPMLTKEDSKNINVVIKKPSKLGLLYKTTRTGHALCFVRTSTICQQVLHHCLSVMTTNPAKINFIIREFTIFCTRSAVASVHAVHVRLSMIMITSSAHLHSASLKSGALPIYSHSIETSVERHVCTPGLLAWQSKQ